MQGLRNELQAFDSDEYDESHKRKASDALKRMESWNLFSDTYEVCLNMALFHFLFIFCFEPVTGIIC